MLRYLLIICAGWFFAQPSFASQSIPVDTGKVIASLVSSHDVVPPGGSFHIALRTELDDHWHTYWRNPGDSGEPVHIEWNVPEGMSVGDIHWPLPQTLATGPIINYGFEGTPLFPVEFTVPPTAEVGSVIMVDADFYYLVCKDVCIPEQGKTSLPIKVGPSEADARWQAEINAALATTPKAGAFSGGIKKSGNQVIITIAGLMPSESISDIHFFPYDQGVLGHSQTQTLRTGTDGVEIITGADYLWESEVPKTLSGVMAFSNNGVRQGHEVVLTVGESVNIGAVAKSAAQPAIGGFTLWTAIIGALIGGLILNLMPCVFPVISIKALSIAKSAHGERAAIRREAWLYTAGVIATFLLLTFVLLALKAGGSEIGWGFQLQSPKVVGGLSVLLFVIGLNLLGMFEFGSGLQNTGADLTQKSGAAGSFFTGALAVIVATPCTAPMMAGAVGYALAAPTLVTLVVFMALAIGFALPFLLIAYVPGLLSKLPKPGPWMIRFKEVLAFPMFAAAIWLVWVLSLQAGEDGVLYVLAGMLAAGFAIWCFKRKGGLAKLLGAIAVLAAVALPVSTYPKQVNMSHETDAWSSARVSELQAEGRPVFVDFTAAWCVTCKVNEKTVLDKKRTKQLFKETNTAFLIADWTNKNDVIAQELAKYGRAGVPLYLVYDQHSVKPKILPQVLTYDVVREAIVGK